MRLGRMSGLKNRGELIRRTDFDIRSPALVTAYRLDHSSAL